VREQGLATLTAMSRTAHDKLTGTSPTYEAPFQPAEAAGCSYRASLQWRTTHGWGQPWMEPGNWCVNVQRLSASEAARTASLLEESDRRSRPLILVGERERRLYPLAPEQIDYIESDGNYVKYYLAGTRYIARESIRRLETLLAPIGFMRIERSLLLNVRAIAYVQPIGRGSFAFTLTSGTRLQSGAAYREGILAALPLRRLGRTE
jgi:hypothetical protein